MDTLETAVDLMAAILGKLITACAYIMIAHAGAWLIYMLPWPPFIQQFL